MLHIMKAGLEIVVLAPSIPDNFSHMIAVQSRSPIAKALRSIVIFPHLVRCGHAAFTAGSEASRGHRALRILDVSRLNPEVSPARGLGLASALLGRFSSFLRNLEAERSARCASTAMMTPWSYAAPCGGRGAAFPPACACRSSCFACGGQRITC